jgi:hypothetical protein
VATVIQNLLALDSAMSEHLVAPDRVRELDAEARAGFARALAEEVAGKDRVTYREAVDGGRSPPSTGAPSSSGSSSPIAGSSATSG